MGPPLPCCWPPSLESPLISCICRTQACLSFVSCTHIHGLSCNATMRPQWSHKRSLHFVIFLIETHWPNVKGQAMQVASVGSVPGMPPDGVFLPSCLTAYPPQLHLRCPLLGFHALLGRLWRGWL